MTAERVDWVESWCVAGSRYHQGLGAVACLNTDHSDAAHVVSALVGRCPEVQSSQCLDAPGFSDIHQESPLEVSCLALAVPGHALEDQVQVLGEDGRLSRNLEHLHLPMDMGVAAEEGLLGRGSRTFHCLLWQTVVADWD